MLCIESRKGSQIAWRSFLMIALAGLFSTALFGQNATFSGRVTDPSGAAVPKAQITVHNLQTGADSMATTTGAGDYTIPYLKPGLYSVIAEAPGFKKMSKTGIPLQVSQTSVIDFQLPVGTVNQSVSVKGNATLDFGNADRGQVIENMRITELPLNGETPMTLDKLDSAVIITGNIKFQRPFDGTIVRNVIVNGGGTGNNEILLDGVSNQTSQPSNTAHNDLSYVVTDQATQDFKIVTNPYDTQYGRMRGGVLDQTLKSGTNRLHGSVYEFAQRSWTNANLWLNDYHIAANPALAAADGTPQGSLDQYGVELDGPIVLPKIYTGRNKSFFVLQYENWHQVVPDTITTTVPNPAWATGDFSGLEYYAGSAGYQPITIYDPLTLHTAVVKGKSELVRNPFPGNKILPGRLNPTALKLLSYYPKPNVTPPAATNPWENNYFVQNPTLDRYRNALAKWSQDFSPRDHFWLRYGYWERYETDSLNGIPGAAAYGEYDLGDRSNTVATQWTRTVNSNLVLDFRAAVTIKSEIADTSPQGFDQTSLGWPASLVSQFGTGGNIFPNISPTDFAALGPAKGNGYTNSDSLTLFPNATWLKGAHTLHAGLDWRIYRYDVLQNPSNPSLSFDLTWTQNCWSCGSGKDYTGAEENQGNGIASMLLGTASSGSVNLAPKAYYTTSYFAPFIQDNWRVSPKLSLTLGLRYDLAPYYVERHNRANYAFDTKTVNPVNAMIPTHTLPNGTPINLVGGVTFLGVNGNPRRAYSTSKLDLQPRFGFAYALTDKMVLRGGFGEFFLPPNNYPIQQGFSSTTTYVGSPDGGKTPIDNLSNPFPNGVIQPAGASLGLLTNLGNDQSYIDPQFKIPNVWQYSLGFQQQFTSNDTLEISYSGDRAPNDQTSQDINHESGAALAQCNVQMGGTHEVCDDNYPADPKAIYGFQTNPFYNIPAFQGSTDYTATTLQGIQFTRPMPEFGAVTEDLTNGARSWYNSLQVTAIHRAGKFLLLHATWNWAKWMTAGGYADNNYLIPSRTLSPQDLTHNVTISGIYVLPVGRGRALLSNSNRIVETLLGGWQVGASSIIQSGFPFDAPGGYDYVHDAKLTKPYRAASGNIQWFAPCVWTTDAETGLISPSPEATGFGCTQPDFIQIPKYGATPNVVDTGIRQPRGFFFDANVAKTFGLWKTLNLKLRLDAFNVLNHPLFQNGFITTLGPNFGQIGAVTGAGQSNQPRQVQIVAKLIW